jgi:hypothetical protein
VPLWLSGRHVPRHCRLGKVSLRHQDYDNYQCDVLSYDQRQRQVFLAQGWAKEKINHRKIPLS